MQRSARFFNFLKFLMCLGAPEVGPSGGVETSIKPMLLEGISKLWAIMGVLGAAAKSIPKNEISKICPENECFVRFLGELLGAHLGLSIFLGAHASLLQCSSPDALKSVLPRTTLILGRFFGSPLGRSIWTIRKKKKKAFPCSVGLVLCFRGALPCSVALVPRFAVLHWLPFQRQGRFPCSAGLVFLKLLRSHAGLLGFFWSGGGLGALSRALLGSGGLSRALLGSPGLSWALLGSPGLSRALLGSPGLSWALLGSPGDREAHT